LLSRGIFEINLIAQDLAAFGMDRGAQELPLLLAAISKLDGDFWVRLLYMHPDHFPAGILDVMAADPRLLPYFDIPFQSGSDAVLRGMNRRRTGEDNRALLRLIREKLPGAVLRSTWLCGFPGESDGDAAATREFLRAARPLWSGCFTYSREEDTPAAKMTPRIPAKTAKQRAAALEALQSAVTTELLGGFTGSVQRVIIDEQLPKSDGAGANYALARAWFQAPEVDGAVIVTYDNEGPEIGKTQNIKITGVSGVDLLGKISP
jgi:ribosomal protein S12 methylthiotransferase